MTNVIVDKILAINHGIYGREECGNCGLMGNYTGMNGAMATHPRPELFICVPCLAPWNTMQASNPSTTHSARTEPRTTHDPRRTYLQWYATTNGVGSLLTLYENTIKATAKVTIQYDKLS